MASQSCCGGSISNRKKKLVGSAVAGTVARASCCSDSKKSDTCCGKADTPKLEQECGCGGIKMVQEKWVTGIIHTPVGDVPQVSTKLSFSDVWGSWKCRWSIGRMDYTVEPGLYCVGTPNDKSPVLVTANYKMTFDCVRKELSGLDAWIMVLDTDGVNVWCSAGKGTFGTEEIVRRIEAVQLGKLVSHRTIIVPQLGATGVSAHKVAKQSGFHVVYGPARAIDIKPFLSAGMKATEEMRTVKFPFFDRLVLTPMELVGAMKPTIIVFGVLFILNAIGFGHYGIKDLAALVGAILAGAVLTPALLPIIPGRAFALKGFLVGLLWAAGAILLFYFPPMTLYGWLKAASYLLLLPSISAYIAMNFTGSSTYTSLSGVDREMTLWLPVEIITAILGVLTLVVNDFIALLS